MPLLLPKAQAREEKRLREDLGTKRDTQRAYTTLVLPPNALLPLSAFPQPLGHQLGCQMVYGKNIHAVPATGQTERGGWPQQELHDTFCESTYDGWECRWPC